MLTLTLNPNPNAGKGEVIQCWDEAVAAMTLGERAMVTCSADTAYGDRGAGGPSAAPPPTILPPTASPSSGDLTRAARPKGAWSRRTNPNPHSHPNQGA